MSYLETSVGVTEGGRRDADPPAGANSRVGLTYEATVQWTQWLGQVEDPLWLAELCWGVGSGLA